jgi:hypothetical protein
VDNTQEAGTRARNNELYPLVALADRAAMDEMILLNMAMVKHTVKSFLGRNPSFGYLQQDLVSQATIGLVQAVNKMAGLEDEDQSSPKFNKEKPNPSSLIGTFIFYRLGELIDSENGLRVPGRTLRRKSKTGFVVPVKEGTVEASYTLEKEGQTDPRTSVDLIDELEGCCETDQELQIMRQRIRGSDDPEIAEMFSIPRSTVNLIRRQIEQRFRERNPTYAFDD